MYRVLHTEFLKSHPPPPRCSGSTNRGTPPAPPPSPSPFKPLPLHRNRAPPSSSPPPPTAKLTNHSSSGPGKSDTLIGRLCRRRVLKARHWSLRLLSFRFPCVCVFFYWPSSLRNCWTKSSALEMFSFITSRFDWVLPSFLTVSSALIANDLL